LISSENQSSQKFGTFLGVYTPSLLTILGVIMYLRLGWMVGNAGMIPSLLIITLCTSITLTTALSLSAIATNMKVGVGGEYFLISRSLGLEIGGAIGIPLFLARTASVTLYAFGLAESFRFIVPDVPVQPVAAIIIILLTLLAGKSANLTLKLQIPLMVAVGVSIIVFIAGIVSHPVSPPHLTGSYPNAGGFWIVLAVFFPAVTGFSAGVGLSGDLKNPSRSIPSGTIAAVLSGYVIYMSLAVALAFAASPDQLIADSLIWMKVAMISALVIPGMLGAILSSTIGSLLGGPRVLQSLAQDRIAPPFLAKTSKTGQPYLATWLTGLLALIFVLLGDLNAVAPLVTIFFLTLYTAINLIAALENMIKDPSFRPRIKIPWIISLSGALGSIAVMFLINRTACIIAGVLELGIWLLLRRKALKSSFGDLRRGFWISTARYALAHLKTLPPNPRDWRPNILVFSGDIHKRLDLVRLSMWLSQDRGLVNVCRLIEKEIDAVSRDDLTEWRNEFNSYLDSKGMIAFGSVYVTPSFEQGVRSIIQSSGIGDLSPNTVMFGWTQKVDRLTSMIRLIKPLSKLYKSLLISRIAPRPSLQRSKNIDIWWRGKENNGDMMLLMAHLLSLSQDWHGSMISIKSVVESETLKKEMEDSIFQLLQDTRIKATPHIVVKPGDKSFKQILFEESREAEISFLGLAVPENGNEQVYAEHLMDLVEKLPTVIFVKNSSFFAGKLI